MYKLLTLPVILLILLVSFHFISIPQGTKPLQQINLNKEISFQPLEIDKVIFCVCDKKNIVKLDKRTLKVIQQQEYEEKFKFNITPLEEYIGAVTESGKIMVLNEDLNVLWHSQPLRKILYNIIPARDKIIIRSYYNDLFLIDKASGEKIWDLSFPQPLLHIALNKNFEVIACAYGNERHKSPALTLKAINTEDGKTLWQFPSFIADFPIQVLGNYFIFATLDGTIYGLDQKTGEIEFQFNTNNKLYDFLSIDNKYLAVISKDIGNDSKKIYFIALDKDRKTIETNLETTFIGAYIKSNNLYLVERSRYQIIDTYSGLVRKTYSPGIIFQAYAHRDGIAIVYKSNFLDRYTNLSYFTDKDKPVWQCIDNAVFYAPIENENSDIVFCKNGKIYIMSLK